MYLSKYTKFSPKKKKYQTEPKYLKIEGSWNAQFRKKKTSVSLLIARAQSVQSTNSIWFSLLFKM